jgi:hypothetical protein
LIGFYATNVYNKRQRVADDRRKDQAIELEKEKLNAQIEIEKVKFGYEQGKWRESLGNEITLRHLESRLVEYSSIWSRIEAVASHRMAAGELTQVLTRELADYVKKWRYSTGGLLAEPTTRDAAYAFQQAVWDYNGTKESHRRIRSARRILRDALRADMGVGQNSFGKSLIDVAAERQRRSDLTNLQESLGISPDSDRG